MLTQLLTVTTTHKFPPQVSGVGITARCPLLEALRLEHCENITDAGLNAMFKHWGRRLKMVELSYTGVEGSGLTAKCPRLEKMSLESCAEGWKIMSCSHCQELGQQARWLLIGYLLKS